MEVLNNPILKNIDLTNKVEIKENEHQNKVKRNDILFNTSSETPEEVATSTVVDVNQSNLYLNSFCFGFRPNVKFSNYYIGYYLRSNHFRNRVFCLAQGISRYNISKKSLIKLKLSLPKLEEQDKIGKIFNQVELLLTLYERKLKLLSQVKKYFLDNLFTEKEYPNLRFKGFTDAWEQRKLEEVTLFIRNGVTIKQNGSYGIPITRIESISTGTLNLSKVGYADIQTDKYKGYYLKNNDILFSNINSLEHIGKVAFVQHLSLDVIHGMNLLNIRVNEKSISSKFIYYRLLIMKYNNLFKKIAKPAVNQASIAISELKKLVIKVPAVNEQCKIQALLTCLEKIITLYESKKQNLNKIKNTLLNTMFI